MNVSMKDAGTCRKTMTIEIPADKITEEREDTLKAYIKFANIPGFRKGKAPKHVVAAKYAKEIDQDLQERVLPKYYHEALQESELKVVNVVDATEVKIKAGEPVSFDVTVDIEPEFKLPKYTDIPVKEEKTEVTDVQVQEQIDSIRNQHANYEEVENKAIEAGDMGQLTYEATVDGTPLQDSIPEAKGIGSGAGYWVSADEHAFIPGMGEAIVGLNIGDKKEVEVTFPEDFMVKELAGVKAVYNVEVTAVRVRTLPEIDETFLSRLQVETEEALRSSIREQLEVQAENMALGQKHDQIVQYLVKKTKLDVPESVVKEQTRNVMYDIANQRMMMGATQEQIAEQQEEILKEAQERALENVKLRYIGLGIAAELEYEASEVEIDEEIATMAIRQRKDAQALRKEMEENDSLSSVGEQIRFNKALDYMVENAKIK
ncbi:trigger factor [Pontiella sulfatireligans]|uniref:Trigger factor n=1 Tax=Pontiella sulfatireligans TaxID=2750658 RepID=A0A6C2UWD9_9BACT|nr:trigger factor [Pontiella sulfatireligans]VGO23427.1 Trigger factor [Pontiella sulfatireligans]